MMHNPLLDSDFLKELVEQRERTVYARIEMLNMQEEPEEEVFGRVTQGTITIDGNSSVRRSFSLTMIPEKEQYYNNYELGLNRKIRLYIGLKNLVNKNYDDVIWFKQGTFLLSTFNVSQSVNSYSIAVQGKDKMCKLNGELGGMIESLTADFGKLISYQRDVEGKLITVTENIPIKTIIREAVHKYGNEPYHNIILNDLDEVGLELLEYRGDKDKPLYLIINLDTNEVENITFNGEMQMKNMDKGGQVVYLDNSKNSDSYKITYDNRVSKSFVEPCTPTKLFPVDGSAINSNTRYSVGIIYYGETCGYRITDLTYPGELTAKVGEAITAILDKIKTMLGNFEYFYDIDGRFVFQKKKNHIQTPWAGIINDGQVDRYEKIELSDSTYRKFVYYVNLNNEFRIAGNDFDPAETYYQKMDGAYVESVLDSPEIAFFFGDSNLVTSFSNTPALTNLKNDFSIWGSKQSSTSGAAIPFHLRYAIDKKPTQYTTSDGLKLFTTQSAEEKKEELEQKYEASKTPNTNGLPEEWWDVHEWAEVYRMRTGEYPADRIYQYCTRVPIQPFQYFKRGGNYSNYELDYEVTTDDIFYNTATNEVTAIHQQCTHDYTYFLTQAQNGIGAYIHNPQIPEKVLEDVDDTVFYDGNLEIITDLDWREIIYQMALDYNAHHNEDDFLINVYKNNEGLFSDNGTTGYESYYADMEGFWRTLYNPRPPIAGGMNFITFIGEVINAVTTSKAISNAQMRDLGEEFYPYFVKDVENDNYKFIEAVTCYTSKEREEQASKVNSFWNLIKSKQYPDDNISTFYSWDSEEQQYSLYTKIALTNSTYKKGMYYIKDDSDYVLCEDEVYDSSKTYYTGHRFEDHVELIEIPSKAIFINEDTRLYQSAGSTYYPLYRYDEKNYYSKEKEISLYDLKEDKVYYAAAKAEDLTLANCKNKMWSYPNVVNETTYKQRPTTKVKEGEDEEEGYKHNAKFKIGLKYFEYAGYERVSTLFKGEQYYTRKEISEGNYEYEEAVYLDPDTTYYTEDPGIKTDSIRVQTFTPGHVYYTIEDGERKPTFTYDKNITYYKNSGFKEVLDLTKCFYSDKYYYYEEVIDRYGSAIQELVALESEESSYYFPIHSSIQHYAKVPRDSVKNGRYYPLERIYDIAGYTTYRNSYAGKTDYNNLVKAGAANEDAIAEQLKNTTCKDNPDYVDLMLLDIFADRVGVEYANQIQVIEEQYYEEKTNAIAADRDPAMSEKDLQIAKDKIQTDRDKKLAYIKAEKNKVSYNLLLVIRNFEYKYRYFNRVRTNPITEPTPEYKFIRYNCYKFKTEDALYDAPTYNLNTGWALDIQDDPSRLVFWFDFLDNDSEICEKYNVKAIGNRPKAVNDDKVKAIYYRETPNVIFVSSEDWEDDSNRKPGYTYVKLGYEQENLFNISARGKTAHAQLEEFLYQHAFCTESISMTTIPVYHLQPNTKISVRDDKSHINGEYIINRLTIPLTYNGTMNISATKAADTIY